MLGPLGCSGCAWDPWQKQRMLPWGLIPCRLEMRNFGVKVSVIEPGCFQTNITNEENIKKHFLDTWEKLPEEIKADYGEKYLKHCKYLT